MYQTLKSPEGQAKEMRSGPESHGGIVSKQNDMSGLYFYRDHSGCSV